MVQKVWGCAGTARQSCLSSLLTEEQLPCEEGAICLNQCCGSHQKVRYEMFIHRQIPDIKWNETYVVACLFVIPLVDPKDIFLSLSLIGLAVE